MGVNNFVASNKTKSGSFLRLEWYNGAQSGCTMHIGEFEGEGQKGYLRIFNKDGLLEYLEGADCLHKFPMQNIFSLISLGSFSLEGVVVSLSACSLKFDS